MELDPVATMRDELPESSNFTPSRVRDRYFSWQPSRDGPGSSSDDGDDKEPTKLSERNLRLLDRRNQSANRAICKRTRPRERKNNLHDSSTTLVGESGGSSGYLASSSSSSSSSGCSHSIGSAIPFRHKHIHSSGASLDERSSEPLVPCNTPDDREKPESEPRCRPDGVDDPAWQIHRRKGMKWHIPPPRSDTPSEESSDSTSITETSQAHHRPVHMTPASLLTDSSPCSKHRQERRQNNRKETHSHIDWNPHRFVERAPVERKKREGWFGGLWKWEKWSWMFERRVDVERPWIYERVEEEPLLGHGEGSLRTRPCFQHYTFERP